MADYSKTRCFIDCDGTLVNSLPKYNVALDALFMRTLTDKHYNEYYHDFNDSYDIIPGEPWKTILADLCRYHATPRDVNGADAGYWDALMRVAYGLSPAGVETDLPVEAYANEDVAFLVVLAEINVNELPRVIRLLPDAKEAFVVYDDSVMNRPSIYGDVTTPADKPLTDLVSTFENLTMDVLKKCSAEDLAIEPVIRFCREYVGNGGNLIIHSGSNKRIVDAFVDKLGISDIVTDRLCTDMMDVCGELGSWGYKTELLSRLLDKYPVNGTRDFVVGDTKGDAFGAMECGLPFFLVWRGYPRDPWALTGDGVKLRPNGVADIRQDVLDDEQVCDAAFSAMIEYAGKVAERAEQAPQTTSIV